MLKRTKVILITIIVIILNACSNKIPKDIVKLNSEQIKINSEQIKINNVYSIEKSHPIASLIDGRTVLLQDSPEEDNYIFITEKNNLKIENKILATYHKKIYTTVVTDEWIVYAEASNDMIKSDWTIFAQNLNTGKRIEIDKGKIDSVLAQSKFETMTLLGPLISASNKKVIWSTFEPDKNNSIKAVIKMYDIEQNKYKVIDQIDISDGEFGKPSIDGEWIVCDLGKIDVKAQGRWGTIFLYNILNNEKKLLDKNLGVHGASIKYPNIVWNADRYNIKMFNIISNGLKKIVNNGNIALWNVSLNDKYVTWYSNAKGLYLYSIKDDKVIDFKNNGVVSGGNFSGNILWWRVKNDSSVTSEWILNTLPEN